MSVQAGSIYSSRNTLGYIIQSYRSQRKHTSHKLIWVNIISRSPPRGLERRPMGERRQVRRHNCSQSERELWSILHIGHQGRLPRRTLDEEFFCALLVCYLFRPRARLAFNARVRLLGEQKVKYETRKGRKEDKTNTFLGSFPYVLADGSLWLPEWRHHINILARRYWWIPPFPSFIWVEVDQSG